MNSFKDWRKWGDNPPPASFVAEGIRRVVVEEGANLSALLERVATALFQMGIIRNIHDVRGEFRNRRTFVNEIADDSFCLLFLETETVSQSLVVLAQKKRPKPPQEDKNPLNGGAMFVFVNPLWAYRDYSALRASADDLFSQLGFSGSREAVWRSKVTAFLDKRIKQETPASEVLQHERAGAAVPMRKN